MHNKKIIAKGLIISILLFNTPIDSIANTIDNYKLTNTNENKNNYLEENIFEKFFNNLFDKVNQSKEVIKVNKNIRIDTVKEVTLNEGEFIPNLNGNPDGFETIRVITTGNKKLVKQDYNNLKTSGIPNIDLSNAKSDNIPANSFKNAKHLTDFKFPQGIKIIGYAAFEGCNKLTGDLTIPDTVTEIDAYAFKDCSGFNGNLNIPNGVLKIGYSSFEGCNNFIGDLSIPNTVTDIEPYAFKGCSNFNGTLSLSKNIKKISYAAFEGCNKLTGDLIIPNSVVEIEPYAFYKCSGFNGKLTIPNGVLKIGYSSFEGCSSITGNLNIPSTVTEIEPYAFKGCSNLTGDLIIPKSIRKINYASFEDCSGFNGKLVIPNTVTDIEPYAFKGCSNLTGDLIIPNSVRKIGYASFEKCSGIKGKLKISTSLTSIEPFAFYACSGLTGELIIPDSIKSIGYGAFMNCSSLEGELIIPNTVTSVSGEAFNGLSNVDKITIKVNSDDLYTDYKKSIIDNLPDTTQTVIDLPYDFDITSTWLETTNKTIGKPIIKNVMDNGEVELVNGGIGEKVSLYIPTSHNEKDIVVLKDNKPYKLPNKNDEDKYIFTESGYYDVTITTTLGNTSNILFEVENFQYKEAEINIEQSEISKSPEDIKTARELVNSLPESLKKDELQARLNSISPDIEFELKNATANLDVYIKSKNMISLSLNTNSVTFEDFSGAQDEEKLNAITLTVNSSLPYDLKTYLPTEIIGSRFQETMNKEIFNIRANEQEDYQTFIDTLTPLTLLSNEEAGNNKEHGIDLKLASGIAHKKDIYKAIIKFEVEQK